MIDKRFVSSRSIGFSRLPFIAAASDALKNISIPNAPALITFWGNKGVGKTTLLYAIADYFSSEDQVEIITIDAIGQLSLEELKQAVSAKISAAALDKSIVIFLDDLDKLLHKDSDSQSFFDFERTVIEPLVEKGNILILCTSRIELNQWREDDVRIRQVNLQIHAMSEDEIGSLLVGSTISSKKSYQLTLGHPKVVGWLQEDPKLSAKDLAGMAWTYFLEDMPVDALSIADIIYQFPIFNIFILQQTFEKLTGQELGYLDCLERIKEYMRRGLLYWDVNIGSYRFTEGAVRRLLARHVLYNDQARFDEVQNIASTHFQSEARSPGYLHLHFVGAIYHIAQAARKSTQQEIGQKCLSWVQSNRGLWLSARWSDVMSAWQGGAGEAAVCEEIQALIGSKGFHAITREIKEARKSMEVNK